MFSRFKPKISSVVKIENLKRGTIASVRAIPGIAFMAGKGGSAIFNVIRFNDYFARYFNDLKMDSRSPMGIAISTIALMIALLTTLYTRFFNMYRVKKPLPARENRLLQTDEELEMLPKEPTCCSPGIVTDSWHVGYKFSQVINTIYGVGNASTVFLSVNSVVNLVDRWMKTEYNGKCSVNESRLYKIILVNIATLIMLYAIIQSFRKYNVHATRKYYLKLFMENGWHEFSRRNKTEIIVASLLNAICYWYTFHAIATMVSENILCHISGDADFELPDAITKLLAGVLSFANFFATILLASGAVFNKQQHAEISQENKTSELGRMRKVLDVVIYGNALIFGAAAFNAFVNLPETVANRVDLTTHPAMIIGGFLTFIFVARIQHNLDRESLAQEEISRRLEREAAVRMEDVTDPENPVHMEQSPRRYFSTSKNYNPTYFASSRSPSSSSPSERYLVTDEVDPRLENILCSP